MSLRRTFSIAGRFLLVVLLAAAVPACKKPVDPAPHLMKRRPAADQDQVPRFPLMVMEFDKALDEATISGNMEIWVCDAQGTPTAVVEALPPFVYLSDSFQIIVSNTTAFATNTIYAVILFGGQGGLASSKGDPIGGGIALRFKTGPGAGVQPTFSAPTQDVGNGGAGGIKFNWTQATEGTPISATYDFYMSVVSEGENMMDQTPDLSTSDPATGTITGLTTGTKYYFIVVCRDSDGNVRVISEINGIAD